MSHAAGEGTAAPASSDAPEHHGVQRLPYVDGIRGVAALIVALGHMVYIVPTMPVTRLGEATLVDRLIWPIRFGTEMVYLFLMVSGFSLYYSERSRQLRGRAPSTYRQFLKRRSWRIGPVYYTALALGLLVFATVPKLPPRPDNQSSQELTIGGFISHLFFVHNFNSDWLSQINAPLWSIAYEMQLYLLFPLIFIAMRRWNPFLVAVAFVAAQKAISLLPLGFPVFGLTRWFVAGCLVAELLARGVRIPTWVTLPSGLTALVVAMLQLPALASGLRHDAIWATAFTLLLLAMSEEPESRRNPMNWSWVRWLGLRSYSLYALHFPVTLTVIWLSQYLGLQSRQAAAFVVGVAGIACLIICAASWKWIERPSLQRVAAVR
jgi:peptidoglycan/LPS O-acetylase OafA/YrhL